MEQISPLFKLTMLELTEIMSVAGVIISIALIATVWITNYRQMDQRIRVDSANLVLKFLEPWHDKKNFVAFVERVLDPEVTQYDPGMLAMMLNQFEDMAVLWRDKTVRLNHIQEYFGPNLRAIRDDAFIQSHIAEAARKNPRAYSNLRRLLERIA